MNLVGQYKALPLWAKIVIIIVITILILVIINKIKNAQTAKANKDSFLRDFKKYCDGKSGSMTYPEATYLALAGKMYQAGCVGAFCYGTDEDAILDVFEQMKTDCDVILLSRAFGKREVQGEICVDRAWGGSCTVDIGTWLQSELGDDEFKEINTILSKKGLKSRF